MRRKHPLGEPCECHGVPKSWTPVERSSAGGYWRCTVKASAYNKAWREANPEKVKASHRAYREANPEKRRESSRAWREANPDYQRNWYKNLSGLEYNKRCLRSRRSKALARIRVRREGVVLDG